jgi:hypothetical protein
MIILLGLVVLVAAVVVGVAGVLANGGDGHALSGNFAVFGYHVTGSTGTLFLYGIVVGAVGLCGLSLLLAGARRTARRGRTARRDLKQSRRETAVVSSERDDLAEQQQRDAANADAHAAPGRSPNETNRPTAAPAAEGSTSSTAAQPSRQPAGSAQGEGPSNQPAY